MSLSNILDFNKKPIINSIETNDITFNINGPEFLSNNYPQYEFSEIGTDYGTAVTNKYLGGCLSSTTKKIYCAPMTATKILEIDYFNKTTKLVGSEYVGSDKWRGCVESKTNLCIYFIPNNSNFVLKYNPLTGEEKLISVNTTMFSKWNGGISTDDGFIIGIPFFSDDVIKIDTKTDTISYIPVPIAIAGVPIKYEGGVLGMNNKIYCSFRSTIRQVLEIDYQNNTCDLLPLFGFPAGFNSLAGGFLSKEGFVYLTPRSASNIVKIDTSTTPPTQTLIPFSGLSNGFHGSTLMPNGDALFCSYSAIGLETFNTSTDVGTVITTPNFTDLTKYAGCVMGYDGNIYLVPFRRGKVGVVKTGTPVLPMWMLDARFNKF